MVQIICEKKYMYTKKSKTFTQKKDLETKNSYSNIPDVQIETMIFINFVRKNSL